MLPLRELQGRLRALIADPVTVSGSLDALAAEVADLGIQGDDRLSAAERVRIYARMYFLRLRDALASDFPALQRALGDEAFDQVVQLYVLAHPSSSPSLRHLGSRLARFLTERPDLAAPWQADLAALEWALVDAFDAADEPALDAARLALLTPDEWPDLALRPVASLRLLAAAAAVDHARDRLLDGETVAAPAAEQVRLRVWRQDLRVYVRRIGADELAALHALAGGCTFAALCEWLAERAAPGDDPTTAAATFLRRWVDDALLAAP